MALPKKVKKHLPLVPEKVGRERRLELLEKITNDGTYLPKGVLHADLDRGVLDYVKNDLKMFSAGKSVPVIDKIITNQNWAQFTTTWNFKDLDKNLKLPFITTVRMPEVKYGTIQGGLANIPSRKHFHYYTVPTWNGERKGADVYKIPQPIPVDIKYNIKLFCNRMSEINEFNKIMMQAFTSKQSYVNIKGHYMPLALDEVSDESSKELEKRKYYIANYSITLKGFLLDEEEFQISPALTRQVSMFEVDVLNKSRRVNPQPPRPDNFDLDITFVSGNTQLSELFNYTADIIVENTTNVASYSVYINNLYVGGNLNKIQINNGDTLKIIVVKTDNTQTAAIKTVAYLV